MDINSWVSATHEFSENWETLICIDFLMGLSVYKLKEFVMIVWNSKSYRLRYRNESV